MVIEKAVKNNSFGRGAGRVRTHCRRCGTCCEKGGPALHTDDRMLIENGHIPARYLFTIREGEPVVDNVKENPIFAQTD